MLTTKQYRSIFTELASKHGVDTLGTWTDDTLGRGWVAEGDNLRTGTYEIDMYALDYDVFMQFIRELRADPRVFTSNNIRLTSYYVKATCLIHDDLWHSMDTINA